MASQHAEKPGGQNITKAEADKMKKAYRSKNKGKTESVGFSAEFVRSLVNNPQADTIWFSFAENDKGENTIIISSRDMTGQTLLDGDRGQLCPPYCPTFE
ncbi:MAG: hypothetical protein ACOYXT_12630 [Bacteroidota bacterium]